MESNFATIEPKAENFQVRNNAWAERQQPVIFTSRIKKPEVLTLNPKVHLRNFNDNQYDNQQLVTLFSKESGINKKRSHYGSIFNQNEVIITLDALKEQVKKEKNEELTIN